MEKRGEERREPETGDRREEREWEKREEKEERRDDMTLEFAFFSELFTFSLERDTEGTARLQLPFWKSVKVWGYSIEQNINGFSLSTGLKTDSDPQQL